MSYEISGIAACARQQKKIWKRFSHREEKHSRRAENSSITNTKRNDILPLWRGWHGVAVTQAAYIKPEDSDSKAAMEKLETALSVTQVSPKLKVQPIKDVM
jgi:hypothetical protein